MRKNNSQFPYKPNKRTMKKLKILFAFLAAISLSACSDSPESPGGINENFINELSRDWSVCTFELTDFETYERNAKTNGEWEKIDEEFEGNHLSLYTTMSFQDGKLWSPISFWDSYSPTPIASVWSAYCKATGEKRKLYTSKKFDYDELNKVLNIGSNGWKLSVIEFTKDKIVLSHDATYVVYADGSKGRQRQVGYYKNVEPIRFDNSMVLQFENDIECYRYILAKAREQFGDTININEVFKDYVILDNPIIDLDEIEKWIDETEKNAPTGTDWDIENWPY